jgi:hypothetical protein
MIANAKRANASDKYATVTSVPIADQITRELLPTTCRYQLVGDPFRRWVRCDAEPQDLSPAVPHVSLANPLWGAPRIHGELLRLGIDVGQTSVAKYMVRRRGPPSQCHRHDCAGTSSSPDQQAIKEAPSDHGLGSNNGERASNAASGRIRSTTIEKIILQRSNIPQRIIRFCVSRQLHGIYDRDSYRSVVTLTVLSRSIALRLR